MKITFFGTDSFSVTILEELKKAGFMPDLIITAPDKKKGRGLKMTAPDAKVWAIKNHIKTEQPEHLSPDLRYLQTEEKTDLFIVASYGMKIPGFALKIPRFGSLNVHPSLLPKYRGATPIENQILNNEQNIGVTIMLLEEGIDCGPIIAQEILNIPSKDHDNNEIIFEADKLKEMLAIQGGKMLARIIPEWIKGKISASKQDDTKATYTRKFTKADGLIDLSADPHMNFLKIRAFHGSIKTYFFSKTNGRNTRVIINSADFENEKLIIKRVTPEGKKEINYGDFLTKNK